MLSLDELSNEVGSLTTSTNDEHRGKYIGAATGSNFAKLLLKQIHLQKLDNLENLSVPDFATHDSSFELYSNSCAPLPPYSLGKLFVRKFVNRILSFFPIIVLKDFLVKFETIYTRPHTLDNHTKYIIFMVLALGYERGERDPLLMNHYNQFKPIEYFNTAQRYLEKLVLNRSLETIQELILLLLWRLGTNAFGDDSGDSWYMGRYIMALSIENGIHKESKDEMLTEMQKEFRNRLFWSVFFLERGNAVKHGRGLSLKMKEITAPLPKVMPDDLFDWCTNGEPVFETYSKMKVVASLLGVELFEIYGVILETVYISRTKGSKPILSIETIINYKVRIQESINRVLKRIDNEVPHDVMAYYEIKIQTHMASIILNRPSPSFPSPDEQSIQRCKDDCLQALKCYTFIKHTEEKAMPSCLHDIVSVGLTMIYCCWKTEKDAELLKTFSTSMVSVMNDLIRFYPNFIKFKNLYIIVSSIIIEGFENTKKGAARSFNDIPMPLKQSKENAKPIPVLYSNPATFNESCGYGAPPVNANAQTFMRMTPFGRASDTVYPGSNPPPFPHAQPLPQHQLPSQPYLLQSQSQSHMQPQNNSHLQSQPHPQQQLQQLYERHPSIPGNAQYGYKAMMSEMPPALNNKNINTPGVRNREILNDQSPRGTIYQPNVSRSKTLLHNYNTPQLRQPSAHTSLQYQGHPAYAQAQGQETAGMFDSMTQELFQDVFKQYYQGNESVKDDINQLFEFQKFSWA
jgi:hypothetical protein